MFILVIPASCSIAVYLKPIKNREIGFKFRLLKLAFSCAIFSKLENLDGSVVAIDHRFQHLRMLITITETTTADFNSFIRFILSLT